MKTKRNILKYILKLMICLAIVFCIMPVKDTSSYVTSLSQTCENTFTGEVETDISTPQKPNTESKQTNTGDNTTQELYIAGMISALVVIFVIWRYRHKGDK